MLGRWSPIFYLLDACGCTIRGLEGEGFRASPPETSDRQSDPIGNQDWPLDQPQFVLGMETGAFDAVKKLLTIPKAARNPERGRRRASPRPSES